MYVLYVLRELQYELTICTSPELSTLRNEKHLNWDHSFSILAQKFYKASCRQKSTNTFFTFILLYAS